MPKQTAKATSVLAKIRNQAVKAHETHKSDETDYGAGGDLPPGIEQGRAQLASIKFDVFKSGDNQGKPYFMASAVVLSPETVEVDGRTFKVAGLHTRTRPIPLCDTPKSESKPTFDDHYADMLNELRKLGVDTESITFDDLETTCEALVEEAPIFGFRTWASKPTKEYPNPQTNHQWTGVTDDEPEEPGDDIVEDIDDADDTVAAEEAPDVEENAGDEDSTLDELAAAADEGDEDAGAELMKAALSVGIKKAAVEGAESWAAVVEEIRSKSEPEAESDEELDFAALGEAADTGDENAIDALSELAAAANLDVDEYETWTELAELLGSEDETPAVPEKGDTVKYKPKGARKALECEVITVFESKGLLTLKESASGKVHRAVKIADVT